MGFTGYCFGPSQTRRRSPRHKATHSQIPYGQTAGYDAGTTGDYFVDAVSGSDANNGLTVGTAKATIGAAITAANTAGGNKTIRVIGDGVRYRESIDFFWSSGSALNTLAIKGYGTDRPVISGAKALTGWTACAIGDEPVVGANWASIYKLTVNKVDFAAPKYWRTIIAEAGAALDLCGLRRTGRTTPDFFTDNIDQTINADDPQGSDLVVGLRSGTWYDTITNPAVLGGFTDAQLSQTTAVVHAFPNIASYMEVTSVASGVLQLETINLRPSDGGADGSYALLNVLPAIAQGQWGYRDNGDGTVTFYCWPNDAANLTADMEIAVRSEGMRIYRGVSNRTFTLEGINFEMFAGGGTRDQCFALDGTGQPNDPSTIRQCAFRLFAAGRALSAKFVQVDLTVENCTFSDGVGFGLETVPGSGGNQPTIGVRVRNCLARDLSQTGFRMFGIRNAVMSDIRSYRTSGGGHANSINFYQKCDNVVVINCNMGIDEVTRLYEGYATNQSSSRLYFLHCVFTMGADGRAYVDQNVTSEVLPTVGGGGYLINCWVPHMEDRLSAVNTGGFTVGKNIMDWSIYNCVVPAIVNTGGVLTRKGNILTNSNATADASETLADPALIHADAANYDFTVGSDDLLNTATGEDCEAIITTLEAAFPSENFRRDANNRVWNPASPGVGPFGQNWDRREWVRRDR